MNNEAEKEVLVVVSKLKNYIRTASGMNTAGSVGPFLSDIIRKLCDTAIESAKQAGRKTVMDRDFSSEGCCAGREQASGMSQGDTQS